MGRSEFHIVLRENGTGDVYLNGSAVEGVQAVRVDGAMRVTPTVTLKVDASQVNIEGLGEIELMTGGSSGDPVELDRILADIDPSTLDREILEGAALGDKGGGAAEYLAAIRRFVRGD